MPPQLALLGCLGFILYALRLDIKESQQVSHALWIPFLWIGLSASRPLSFWLNPRLAEQIDAWAGPSQIDFSGGSALDRNVLILLMLIGLFVLAKRAHSFKIDLRSNKAIFLLYAFMLLSIIWAVNPGASAKRWLRAFGDVIMVLLILSEADEREAFGRVMRRCAIVLLPLSLLFIKYYRQFGIGYGPFGEMMNVGVTTQKNALGALCAFSGIYVLWRIINARFRFSPTDAILLLLSVYLLHLSDSATSLIVFVAGGLILIFEFVFKLSKKNHNRAVVGLFLFFALLQVFMTGVSGDSLIPRFFSAAGRDVTLTGRVPLWGDLIPMGMTRPVAGAGYGGFWFSPLSSGLWIKHSWRPVSGHNGYIDIFMDLGFIGIILFVMVLVRVYRRILNTLDSDASAGRLDLTLFFMIVLHNLTESSFIKAVSFLWILFLFISLVPENRRLLKMEDREMEFLPHRIEGDRRAILER